MQRYGQGLKVPKHMVEVFSGETTLVGGSVVVDLRYTPVSLSHVSAHFQYIPGHYERHINAAILTGRSLTLYAYTFQYEHTDVTTGSANSGGAGADPHTHAIGETREDVVPTILGLEPMDDIIVYYEVA